MAIGCLLERKVSSKAKETGIIEIEEYFYMLSLKAIQGMQGCMLSGMKCGYK